MSWYLSDGISSADCITAFQPIGAASATAALVNLNNPGTHNATVSVAPGWTTSGWSFNGSNQYVDTSVVPAANMTVIVRCDAFSGTATLVGHYLAAAARLEISGDGGSSYYCNAGSVQVGPLTVTGVYAVSGTQGYRNGAADGAATGTAFSGTATQTLLIGARRREDTSGIDSYGDQTIQAVAIYSRILSAAEVQAVSTAMAALSTNATPPTLTAAAVPATNGAQVALTFSTSVTGLAVADYAVIANGLPVAVTGIAGSGATWTLALGQRWIRAGQTVTLSYTGTATVDGGSNALAQFSGAAVTNNSPVSLGVAKHVGSKVGAFISFSLASFLNRQWGGGGPYNTNLFAPTNLSIDQWLDAAALVGARYAVLTVKNVDGFTLWPTQTATAAYSIASSAWYAANGQPNLAQQFVTKCHARGMRAGAYFPMFDARFESLNPTYTAADLIAFVQAQLRELLPYGFDVLWTDTWCFTGADAEAGSAASGTVDFNIGYGVIPYAPMAAFIKGLSPNIIIVENNHQQALGNTDVVEFEVGTDGMPPAGNLLPAEATDTLAANGYYFWDQNITAAGYKNPATIRASMLAANAARSAYLINIAPDTTGRVPAAQLAALAAIGAADVLPDGLPTLRPTGINGSAILGMI